MTLDEAICHAEEVAESKKAESEIAEIQGCDRYALKCEKCAEQHRQLAKWLKALKAVKNIIIQHDSDNMPEDFWYIDRIREEVSE